MVQSGDELKGSEPTAEAPRFATEARSVRQLECPILDALGNIGDLVGGLGVIVTLAYLALQIRQNTRSVRSAAYQSVASQSIDIASTFGADSDFARIYAKGALDTSSLDAEEMFRFDHYAYSIFRSFENLFYQYNQGVVEPALWAGFHEMLTQYRVIPGFVSWWESGQGYFSEEFRIYVEAIEVPSSLSNKTMKTVVE